MKNLDQFEISENEMNNIDGGTFCLGFNFSYSYCAPKTTTYYCAPKTTCTTTTCTTTNTSCSTPKTTCLPSVVSATGY